MTLLEELALVTAQRNRIAPDAFTLAIRVVETGVTANATRWHDLNDTIDEIEQEIAATAALEAKRPQIEAAKVRMAAVDARLRAECRGAA